MYVCGQRPYVANQPGWPPPSLARADQPVRLESPSQGGWVARTRLARRPQAYCPGRATLAGQGGPRRPTRVAGPPSQCAWGTLLRLASRTVDSRATLDHLVNQGCCRSPPAASRGSLPWPSAARGAARGALAKVAALARARGHRPRSAASTASSSCARPSACAVIIMSCGVWVNSVKSMLGKLIIHLESQAQELTNHTHTRPWLLTEGVLGWWSGEHMRTRSPTPGGGRAGRHAARSAGVCGAATATPRARTRRPRRQGCLPRRAARARTAPASLDSRS